MPKGKPRKPTNPYGYISFPKNGSVEKRMFTLSEDKKTQEREVIEGFIVHLASILGIAEKIKIEELPEADQDFLLRLGERAIHVQITEIPLRDYTIVISKDEYNAGLYHSFYHAEAGQIPLAVDERARDSSIARSIQHKLAKNYAKGQSEILWLLIFSTTPYLTTTYYEAGERCESAALKSARQFLGLQSGNVFDELWFFNLLTQPTRIWPLDTQNRC